jgi:hypothetical protein
MLPTHACRSQRHTTLSYSRMKSSSFTQRVRTLGLSDPLLQRTLQASAAAAGATLCAPTSATMSSHRWSSPHCDRPSLWPGRHRLHSLSPTPRDSSHAPWKAEMDAIYALAQCTKGMTARECGCGRVCRESSSVVGLIGVAGALVLLP